MRRYPIKFVIVVCITSGGIPARPQDKPSALGMLIQTSGQVFVQRGPSKAEARLADLLYPGDVLITAAGEAVVMYCPSSQKLEVPKNATLELRADAVRVLKGAAPAKSPARCLLPGVALGSESLERVGAFRARGFRPVIQYLGGSVITDRPIFFWGPVEGAEIFRLVLRDAERDVSVWETQTTSLSVSYPESIQPLHEGSYEWKVQAEAGGQTVAQGTANFEVRRNEDLSKRLGSSQDAGLLQALELEGAGYYAEAATLFRKFRDANPRDARLTRHLAWLYWNAGLIEAFNEEWKRLDVK
jgi:hypothetical protein